MTHQVSLLLDVKLMPDGMLSGVAVEPAAVVGRMTSIAGRTYSLVKSDLGLIIILLTYSFLGAVILHHAEYNEERRTLQKLDQHKRRCVSDIVNASTAAFSRHTRTYVDFGDWYQNLSQTVEALVDSYVDVKEHLRPNSKAPKWTLWGALFFCGTVYTTVGQCSPVFVMMNK